tara:strand:+ start:211 stop:633 length:423 start_codon:yes stop_codon:yes gene_type:complete
MPYPVYLKLPDGSYRMHLSLRTNEWKEPNTMKMDVEKYTKQQETSSIDTLTNHSMSLATEVNNLEDALNTKLQEAEITNNVLKDKLKLKLLEMGEILPEPVDTICLKEHEVAVEEIFDEDEGPLELKENEYIAEGEDADL